MIICDCCKRTGHGCDATPVLSTMILDDDDPTAHRTHRGSRIDLCFQCRDEFFAGITDLIARMRKAKIPKAIQVVE